MQKQDQIPQPELEVAAHEAQMQPEESARELLPEAPPELVAQDSQRASWEDAFAQNPARQPAAARGKGRLKRLSSQKHGKLKIGLLAGAASFVVFFVIGIIVASNWDGDKEKGMDFGGLLRSDLADMVESGEAKPYGYYYQQDTALGIPAFRALLPEGWTATGKVSWNYAGTQFPALASFTVYAPQQAATMYTVSQMQYVQGEDPQGAFAQSGVSIPEPFPTPEGFAQRFLPGAFGMYLPMFHKTENLDPQGTMAQRYRDFLQPSVTAYAREGITLRDISLECVQLEGTALFREASHDISVRMILCGYQLQKGDASITVWQVIGLQTCAAPEGTLAPFLPQMHLIAANQTMNEAWLTAREQAAQAALTLVQDGTVQTVTDLDAHADALLAAAKKNPAQEGYGKNTAQPNFGLFADLLNEWNHFTRGEEAPVYLEKQFLTAWVGKQTDADDIILAVKPQDYIPRGSLEWEQLTLQPAQ